MEYEWRKDPLPDVVEGGVIEIEWNDWHYRPGVGRYEPWVDGPWDWERAGQGVGVQSGSAVGGGDTGMLRWRWLTNPAAAPTRHEATAEVLRDLSDAAARLDGEGLDELYEEAVELAVRLKMLGAGS